MKIRWSINVFACFPMFSQATQHFFHGRWKKDLLWPRYGNQRKYWADDARLQKKRWVKTAVFIKRTGLSMSFICFVFFFRNCLKWDAFLKEKPSIKSADFKLCFPNVFPATSGMPLFSKEEARADHGQGMAGANQGWSSSWSLGASSLLFQ